LHCRFAGQEARFAASPAPSRRDWPLFVGLLVGVILILGGLTFFPALALGPIVEHFQCLRLLAEPKRNF
jgi:K+-transporting ATPase ATPase A chain